ncbi:hypothetical protein NUW58_g2558 [Xylaria curta]|uniref:Uncharacterized protein n=1 Tax=Xylaria curta TaxID=42375 RepID=A0ACC1PGB5_9PEZI|nr:hypothetical protein NUW58_g2558 [Xylaria curta]
MSLFHRARPEAESKGVADDEMLRCFNVSDHGKEKVAISPLVHHSRNDDFTHSITKTMQADSSISDGHDDSHMDIDSPTGSLKSTVYAGYDSGRANGDNFANHDFALSPMAAQRAVSFSTLESLPSELRNQILVSMPDLETLGSIIRASPTMYAQYLHNRHKILSAFLSRELDGFYVDAYANLKSHVGELGFKRENGTITKFLEDYQKCLTTSDLSLDTESLPPSEVLRMATYHMSIARPLLRRYGSWALQNLRKEVLPSTAAKNTGCGVRDVKLSRSEEIRIFRALYRHEIYHNLFGHNLGERHGSFPHYKVNDIFFGVFEPWEREAIGCVDAFIRQQYDNIFDEIRGDLHPQNIIRQPNSVYNPEGSFDLDRESYERQEYMDGIIARGLRTMARVLKINSHEELVSEMKKSLAINHLVDGTLMETTNMISQFDRRDGRSYSKLYVRFCGNYRDFHAAVFDDRDLAERRQDRMRFLGDSMPLSGPPLAWVLLWDGKYVNIFGEFVPTSLKRWGYVMWDARRWADVQAKELISSQWDMTSIELQFTNSICGWDPLSAQPNTPTTDGSWYESDLDEDN